MSDRPSASALCAVGLGVAAGFAPSMHWTAEKPRHSEETVRLAAASQYLVGAELRRAGEILTTRTTEAEAPQVDKWLKRLPAGGHAEALRVILNHPAPLLRQRWVNVLFGQWAVVDREAALKAAEAVESPVLRLAALNAVMKVWGGRDARKAWDYALAIPDPLTQSQVIGGLLQGVSGADLKASLDWAQAINDPFLRRKALEQIARTWTKANAVPCMMWARTLEDPVTRRAMLGIAMARMATQSPIPAFNNALAETDQGTRRELLSVVIQNVSYARATTALTWLRTNQARLDGTLQPALRVLGGTLANDRTQVPQILLLARNLEAAPLADSLLAGAALRYAAQGLPNEARRLLGAIGPGIEREEVKSALNRR